MESNKLTLHWTNINLVSRVLKWWKWSRPANILRGQESDTMVRSLLICPYSLQWWMPITLLQGTPNCLTLILAGRHVNVRVHDMGSVDGRQEAWLFPLQPQRSITRIYGNKTPNLNSQNINWTLQTIIQIHSDSGYSRKIWCFLSPSFAPLSPWPTLLLTALHHK